jgi:hypothetical protein
MWKCVLFLVISLELLDYVHQRATPLKFDQFIHLKPLIAPTKTDAASVHLISVSIGGCLSSRQGLRGSRAICVVICAVQMGYLVKNATSTVIIIIRASRRVLGESPVSVVRAWNDNVGTGNSVQESRPVRAVTVGVCARDLGGGGLYANYTIVD